MKKAIAALIAILAASQAYCYSQSKPTKVITAKEKVYGLSKLWQEVNYNFAYKYKIENGYWDSLYTAMIPQVEATTDDYQYFRLLERFIAPLNDGHSLVGHKPQDISDTTKVFLPIINNNFGEYNIWFENIEDKVIVTAVNRSKSLQIPIGSEVIEVNGIAIREYIKNHVMPLVCQSTPHAREMEAAFRLFEGLEEISYDVAFRKPDNSLFTVKLTLAPCSDSEYDSMPSSWQGEDFSFQWIDNNIAYVAINTFADESVVEQFNQILPELKCAKEIIIDIRNNNGGNGDYALAIAHHITLRDTILTAKTKVRINNSYKRTSDANIDYDEQASENIVNKVNSKDRIGVPIAILTSNSTVSAAEDFLIFIDGQKHIKRIGQLTNGSTGQPMSVDLVKGIWVSICAIANYHPNGDEFVGVGIKPHIEVVETLKDRMEGRDKTLEIAINELRNGYIK